jgi:dihydrodipicolinate synthase/N-acetylneuraminate lyase
MKELKGIMPLIPTPLTDEGEIDEDSLKKLIDFEMENGCYGIGVLAAIGEGYLISHDAWEKVIKISVKHMNGKGPVMAGCPSLGTLSAIQLCKESEDLGADAILAFNPQGFRSYSIQELIDHYMALTDSVKIHVAPYARGEDSIPYEVISELFEKKRISYMKYAWKSCEQLEKMAKNLKSFFIFCGADTFTLRYLLLGCKGVLTATAAMLPKEHVNLLAMINKGDIQGARELYSRAITSWNDIGFNNMSTWQAVHKIALKEMGIIKSAKVIMPQSMPAPHQIEEVKWFVKHYTNK